MGFDYVAHQFAFHLADQGAYLDVQEFVSREHEEEFAEVLRCSSVGTVIMGNREGRFRVISPPIAHSGGVLILCPECLKTYFASDRQLHCGFCAARSPWIQERDRLSWFGYPGDIVVVPRDITDAIRRYPSEQKSLTPSKTLEENDLFSAKEADAAQNNTESGWEKVRNRLSGKARTHLWPKFEAVEALAAQYPNFAEVCDLVRREIHLAEFRKSAAVRLPNLLLVGSPSCGKSSFSDRLAAILVGEDRLVLNLGQQTPFFAITGSDQSFKNGRRGIIVDLLSGRGGAGPVRNPLLILDEIDKIAEGSQFSPLPALLGLLEKRDARAFRDEYFRVPVDASGVQYLALANDRYAIPAPLMSRFELFSIPDYTEDQFLEAVVPAIYHDWRQQFHEEVLPELLNLETKRVIAREVSFIARKVVPVLDRMAANQEGQFRPTPSWEWVQSRKSGPSKELSQ